MALADGPTLGGPNGIEEVRDIALLRWRSMSNVTAQELCPELL
jgi:hypothetical protein